MVESNREDKCFIKEHPEEILGSVEKNMSTGDGIAQTINTYMDYQLTDQLLMKGGLPYIVT